MGTPKDRGGRRGSGPGTPMSKKHHHSGTPLIGSHKKKGRGKEPLVLLPSSLRGWIVCICITQLMVCGLAYLTPFSWFSIIIACGSVLGLIAACFRSRRLTFAYLAIVFGVAVCEGLVIAHAFTSGNKLHPVSVFIYILSATVQLLALIQTTRYWLSIRGSADSEDSSDSDNEGYA